MNFFLALLFASPFFRAFAGHFFSLYAFTVLAAGGGATEQSPTPLGSAPSPSPVSVISGTASKDLGSNLIGFNVTITAKEKAGSFSLYSAPGISRLIAGRASARIIGPLRLSLAAVPAADATAIFVSGFFALRQEPIDGDRTYATDVALVGQYPGAVAYNVTLAGSSISEFPLPHGIHDDAIVFPVVGRRPRCVYSHSSIGAAAVVFQVSLPSVRDSVTTHTETEAPLTPTDDLPSSAPNPQKNSENSENPENNSKSGSVGSPAPMASPAPQNISLSDPVWTVTPETDDDYTTYSQSLGSFYISFEDSILEVYFTVGDSDLHVLIPFTDAHLFFPPGCLPDLEGLPTNGNIYTFQPDLELLKSHPSCGPDPDA